jgi:prevent-host-death family protein
MRIGVRELRQHASRYLRLVKAGETIEVTERGELVALLVAPSAADNAREVLAASGRIILAESSLRMPKRIVLDKNTPSASDTLAELRGERID